MPKITELYAFVSIGDEPDDEGIIGFQTNDGRFYPLVREIKKNLAKTGDVMARFF